ncbi:MAG: PKD domain-containing protein [Candidatus Gracilibacteria bacterium]
MKKIITLSLGLVIAATCFFSTGNLANAYSPADLCGDISSGTDGWVSCGGSGSSSFTNFEGGLQAPSKTGYDESLTQVTSAREFIIKVVNFALGFLGLIAVIIIIYGGIRYVTSAGENDGVEKGKKSIMYAALGLVIVMGSYAIVNTLLKAPGGTDQGSNGAATMQSETQQMVVFSIDELKNIPVALIKAYTAYSQNQTDFLALNQGISQVWDTSSTFKSISDMQSALSSMEIGIQSAKNKLSEIGMRTSKYSALQDRVAQFGIYTTSWLGDKRNKSVEISKNAECISGCPDLDAFQADLSAKWSELVSYLVDTADGAPPKITDKDAKFMAISFAAMKKDNEDTFDGTVNKIKEALQDLENSTQGVAGVSDIENTFKKLGAGTSSGLMDELKNADTKADPGIVKEKIIAIVQEIIALQKTLANIQFVEVHLSADQAEGNAPLIVNFNTQGSKDPTGQSIKDDRVEWDLNGNGEFNQGEIWSNCKEQKLQSTTCIYTSPGTYRIAAKISSADTAKIASGKAYITVKVLPPKAKIKLHAYPKIAGVEKDVPIMEYDEDGFLIVNKPSMQVTLTQARNEIKFDSTGTTSSNASGESGTADTIQSVRWDFGDGSDIVEGEPSANSSTGHTYKDVGNYTVKFEVTDKKGIRDRKVFVVIVSSIASLIDVQPEPVGKTGEDFTFDGRSSSSDNGQITKYEWTVTPSDAEAISIVDPLLTRKFVKPGLYSVSLRVADTTGSEATSKQEIKIESFPPIAKFSYLNPKVLQPAVLNFDATRTYDPDGVNKDITYLWTIDGDAKDYKIITGDEKSAKMTVKFANLNTYKVVLKVADKNEPEKTTIEEKEVPITSLLDIAWADKVNTDSASLDDKGEAQAKFEALSEHATNYDFDFGDSETESGVPASGKIDASHVYKKAGVFQVRVVVSDDEGNKNSLTRRVIIGGSKKPIAVVKLLVNGEEVDVNNSIEVSRKDVITFDATGSINTNGSKSGLKYQWDFGDGKKSTKDIATYTYKELTKKPNDVTLKITSSSDATASATDTLKVSVISMKPEAKSIIAVPEGAVLKTPLRVNVSMIEPSDADGRVVSYKWWYFDINNPEDKLGEQITTSASTMITVGTRGNEGDTYKYKFAGSLTDDNNQEVLLEDLLGTDSLPTLDIANGPNKSPIAKFSADKTNVKMGESITFSSSSTDPDGKITTYIWDTDGTGFAGKEQSTKASTTVKYDKPIPEGVNVRLKVIDNNFGETVSDPITVYVTSKAKAPKAAFTYVQETGTKNVTFKNNSSADTENGATIAKYIWDFDTISSYQAADSDGDGKKDNDTDSSETNPKHSYSAYSIYYVKLTVVDSFGSETKVTNPVEVKGVVTSANTGTGTSGTGTGGFGLGGGNPGISFGNIITSGNSVTNSSFVLKIATTPATEADNKIHLSGATGVVKFDFSGSTGDIAKIVVDKNIYFDSDNNGLKDDDANFQTTNKANYYQSSFDSAWGKTAVKVTAYSKTGTQDSIIKEIVFDSLTQAGSNNVFVVPGSAELYAALAGMFGFGILSAKAIKRKRSKRIKK